MMQWVVSICEKENVACAIQDLYKDGFFPLLSEEEMRRNLPLDAQTLRYTREISSAQALLFLHPIWWGMPPAIVKGWLDRCLLPGIAFEKGEDGTHQPLLTFLSAGVIATADYPMGKAGEALKELWKYALEYCGISLDAMHILENKRSGYDHQQLRKKTEEIIRTLIAKCQNDE